MIRFREVEEVDIRQMAALLAKRHEKERKEFPFLPRQFEEIDETEKVIRHRLDQKYVSGIVAVRGIDVIGYLLYEFRENNDRGRFVEIGYDSLAISDTEHPGLLRLMYADAGAEWVKNGYFHHVLYAPLGNHELLEQWFEQAFRYEQKYGLLSLDDFNGQPAEPQPALSFRSGGSEDAPLLKKIALWNSIHQASAPSWLPITKEGMQDVVSAYESLSGDEEAFLWFAEQRERLAGFHVYFRKEDPHSLVIPSACAVLTAASTNPDMRGKGIGRTLANHCFHQMQEAGFRYLFADWHTPNQLASYFWPRLGFRPVMVRLTRQIDPRIAWAHGRQ